MKSRWERPLVALGLLLVGALVLWLAYELRRDRESLAWPSTTGKIIPTRVTYNDDNYFFNASYEYSVDRQRYASDRLSFGPSPGFSKREAERQILQHPVGSEVEVFYDPKQPQTSVLWPGAGTRSFLVYMG